VLPTRLEKNTWVSLGVFDFKGDTSPTVTLSNFTRDGTYDSDIAWDAIAVQPLTAKPSHFVVGIGDSFSSGEGTTEYTRVSNQYGDDPATRNACHRSDLAWARLMTIPHAPGAQNVGQLADGWNADMDFHFAACSGAVIGNVVRSRTDTGAAAPPLASQDAIRGQWGELTQLDQGWIDENTTLVTLTVGGNDLKWAQAIEACAYAANCAAPGFTRDGDPLPLKYMILNRIHGSVKTDTARLISEIRGLAPHALIMLVGYPQLFVSGRNYAINDMPGLPPGFLISAEEVTFLNDMAGVVFADLTATVASGENLAAVDARPEFAGHELEMPPTNFPYLNPMVLAGDWFRPADDDGEPSSSKKAAESGHPNIDGSNAYARAVSGRLATRGYTW
jgi:lysophospholipase L1-like esterase